MKNFLTSYSLRDHAHLQRNQICIETCFIARTYGASTHTCVRHAGLKPGARPWTMATPFTGRGDDVIVVAYRVAEARRIH